MKKTLISTLSVTILFLSSFATDNKKSIDGKTLFLQKGCVACHQPDKDSVGPPLKKIASTYKGKEVDRRLTSNKN